MFIIRALENVIFGGEKESMDLGNGFYLEYHKAPNDLGGYHPVAVVLKNHNDILCRHRITGLFGDFIRFPGVKEGPWMDDLDMRFTPSITFTFSASQFENGVCRFKWMVQPDGRYFADSDGFGAEKYPEINLYSRMNTKGKFLCPFTDKLDDN